MPSPKKGFLGAGRSSTASNEAGPFTTVSLATKCCIDCSAFTQGPPVPHQPGPDPNASSMPNRSASRTACTMSRRHSGLMNPIGPRGTPMSTSNRIAPPMPASRMASKSAVIPSAVRLPSMKYQ